MACLRNNENLLVHQGWGEGKLERRTPYGFLPLFFFFFLVSGDSLELEQIQGGCIIQTSAGQRRSPEQRCVIRCVIDDGVEYREGPWP